MVLRGVGLAKPPILATRVASTHELPPVHRQDVRQQDVGAPAVLGHAVTAANFPNAFPHDARRAQFAPLFVRNQGEQFDSSFNLKLINA